MTALHRHGKKKWNRHVLKTIETVDSLLHYDVLYLGGGNARHLSVDLPAKREDRLERQRHHRRHPSVG